MEIENEHDDKTETGQSFVYIDGFLVKSITINILLLISETYKIKWKFPIGFESALNNKNDLVHCPSITLFESIPRKCGHSRRRKVWPNQTGKIQNWCNG
ncbi:CNT_collapsed_G0059750.mRNA.1.CDS.1 [Saccharomyces cerevisiae]|nr:CNT_collapsed_G0059750.mRNA.1.CDS.1 [Saccharomyces cerevisiae]